MAKPVYKFGPFSVNPQARLLFRGGERVSLPPKAADLLIVLLEHDGELVTKEELLKQVWPDTFVEEGSLSKHIFLLRKTLGESDDGTPYIDTAPKRAYRFIGCAQPSNSMSAVTFTAEERTAERLLVLEESDSLDKSPRRFPSKALAALIGLGEGEGAYVSTSIASIASLAGLSGSAPRRPLPIQSIELYGDGRNLVCRSFRFYPLSANSRP